MLLDNFYRLSAPPAVAVKKREKRVAEVVAHMGHKYVLSKSMPRIK